MIVLTSLLLSLAPLLAWTPLPPSVPETGTEGQRYDKSEHSVKDDPTPMSTEQDEGNLYNDSYFGQEHNPYTEDYLAAPASPPTPLNEPVPPQPYSNYVWVPGRWDWDYDHWRWIYGEWKEPPYEGAEWEPGYWYKFENSWYWKKGRWK